MADLFLVTMGAKKLNEKKPIIKRETFVDVSNISNVVSVGLAVIAGYLAWNRNAGQTTVMKLIYTIIAVMFATIYLIYYVIVVYVIGEKQTYGGFNGLFGGKRRRRRSKKASKAKRSKGRRRRRHSKKA